jgi:Leucine-rich repeat (LRR) protein
MGTINRRKFQMPVLLVSVNKQNKNHIEYYPSEYIKEATEVLHAFRYFRVVNSDDIVEVFKEASRVLLRNFIDGKVESAIQKNLEKKNFELTLKSSLTILPSSIYALSPHLFKLCLSGNSFKFFPTEVLSLVLLQELDLSDNQIVSIPNEIASLTSLLRFDMENNLLETLPISSVRILHHYLTCSHIYYCCLYYSYYDHHASSSPSSPSEIITIE